METRLFSLKTTDEIGQWYNDKYKEMGGSWHTPKEDSMNHINRIRDFVNDTDGQMPTLLDLGFGGGWFLNEAINFFECTGIEVSSVGLKEAEHRLGNRATLELMDIENMSFPDEYFSVVASIGTLEHVIDIPKAVSESFRVLKQGGVFYVYAPNTEWIHEDQPNEVRMDQEEWEKILEDAGFICEFFEKVGDNNIYVGIKPFDEEI